MLRSLEIKNFRNLRNLRIQSLERINLITGKNNTGKSSLLEAIAIYVTKGDLGFISELLSERGEYPKRLSLRPKSTETYLKALSSLFTDRKIDFFNQTAISIGEILNTSQNSNTLILRFLQYIDEVGEDEYGNEISKRVIIDNFSDQISKEDLNIGFGINLGNEKTSISTISRLRITRNTVSTNNLQLITTRNIDRLINGRLWDSIALTEKEKFVIDCLRIIEPNTERIAFIEDYDERSAVIKLSNSENILPLRSMGDGMNRILTIILALVNAQNSFLLIDEFENGLHYSVQEQLWKIIFDLSEKLNVQVFATTHSEDCISGFESILNSKGNENGGKLIRLDNINGNITQVEFNAKELKISNDHNIEIR
jgi:AAA15 family ATPase/GTPase